MNGLIMCTKQCNMRCKYCFEESIHRETRFSVADIRAEFAHFVDCYLRKFTEELIAINKKEHRKRTTICFHGGEPLLVGNELLERAFRIVREYPDMEITTQTNATLIDDETIALYKKYDVHVGISIDGYEELNDRYRVMVGNKGSFSAIYRNLKKMQQAGILVGALATVTAETVRHPQEFYDFFKDNHLDFSFNPLFLAPDQAAECDGLSQKDFIDFYKKMFYIWINDNESDISITCFDRIIKAMAIKDEVYMEVCTYIPDCSLTTVAICTNGDFYRCLHYSMDGKHRIGNIACDNLCIAYGDEAFAKRPETLRRTTCKDCDIFEYCYGGCPYVSETTNGTIMGKDNTCASQKAIVHEIYRYLQAFSKKPV